MTHLFESNFLHLALECHQAFFQLPVQRNTGRLSEVVQFLASKSLRVWQKHSAFSEENWLPDCYVLACFTQCLLKKAAARLFNFLRNLLHQNSLNCQIGLHILCNDGIRKTTLFFQKWLDCAQCLAPACSSIWKLSKSKPHLLNNGVVCAVRCFLLQCKSRE